MTATEQPTTGLQALSNGMADAVASIGAALVMVEGRPRQAASGVVYAAGLVLTADHVLEREEDIKIQTHDGQVLAAQFVGRDPASDLAVLRVTGLNSAPARAASGEARVGQMALAVGRPSAEGVQASLGVVSAVGGPVRVGKGAMLERYLRTDATPYPGFSGGALVDISGAVLGITTTGLARGVTMAIPAAIAWRVADTLTHQGKIKRGFLGISSQPVHIPAAQRAGRQEEEGLLIMRVEDGAPAQQGGVLLGDILVALDNHPVQDPDDLQALLTGERVGQAVPVTVLRGGVLQTLQITIAERS